MQPLCLLDLARIYAVIIRFVAPVAAAFIIVSMSAKAQKTTTGVIFSAIMHTTKPLVDTSIPTTLLIIVMTTVMARFLEFPALIRLANFIFIVVFACFTCGHEQHSDAQKDKHR